MLSSALCCCWFARLVGQRASCPRDEVPSLDRGITVTVAMHFLKPGVQGSGFARRSEMPHTMPALIVITASCREVKVDLPNAISKRRSVLRSEAGSVHANGQASRSELQSIDVVLSVQQLVRRPPEVYPQQCVIVAPRPEDADYCKFGPGAYTSLDVSCHSLGLSS